MEKKYWKSPEEKHNLKTVAIAPSGGSSEKPLMELINEEIAQKPASRRNFLKFCGFSFASVAIATSCKNPVNTAVPYLNKPEEVTPGTANYYASTYYDGHDYNSILVKVRDGRPIKIDGNDLSPLAKGTSSARVQASVLSLYDDGARYKSPKIDGKDTTWNALDSNFSAALSQAVSKGNTIAIVGPTVISPSMKSAIAEFTRKYPTARYITYDPVSYGGMLKANENNFGKSFIPVYQFDKAEVVVSFGADFLGTWLLPTHFAGQWANTRRLTEEKKTMSELTVFESGMSLTGANADYRFPLKPSDLALAVCSLYNELAKAGNMALLNVAPAQFDMKPLASKLLSAKGKSLVVCGMNHAGIQSIVNQINVMLESYGNTLDAGRSINTRSGNDTDLAALVQLMNQGKVEAVVFANSNPAYTYPDAKGFTEALKKVPATLSFATAKDETSALCKFVAPDHHLLESWGDAEPVSGLFSLQQPCIRNIFDTRQGMDSLLKWSGSTTSALDYIKQYWAGNLQSKQSTYTNSTAFWTHSLQNGILETNVGASAQPSFRGVSTDELASSLANLKAGPIEICAYESVAMGNGQQSNNPWLMEMPDPISKVCWDNFAAVDPATAKKMGLEQGDMVKLSGGIELPVLIQPGQAEGSVSVSLGYGRSNSGKVADGIGANAYTFMPFVGSDRLNFTLNGEMTATGKKYPLVTTQMHHSMEGRDMIRETTLAEWVKTPSAGNEKHEEVAKHNVTLYKEYKFEGHHWGMAIDLNACTGCGACVIGCQAENNVPVIGKEQVAMTRIMHWMRIDRYYSGNEASPSVNFQPVMCQQCDNAPCENVCPVSATNHSSEGLNQMAYNRCIGTKYCINNCPYKVRRFNWFRYATNDAFDYNMNSDLGRMVLNPDVTVRERGVVEKCTFCVQRIQEGKLKAKLEGRPLADGEIVPACMQACPSGAIIFGDMNDPESRISKALKNERNYNMLEELHILPSVGYLTKVRNRDESHDKA